MCAHYRAGMNGGVLLVASSIVAIQDCFVVDTANGLAAHMGGMAHVSQPTSLDEVAMEGPRATLSLRRTTVAGFSATLGGSIAVRHAQLVTHDAVIVNSTATSFGGGVYATVRTHAPVQARTCD